MNKGSKKISKRHLLAGNKDARKSAIANSAQGLEADFSAVDQLFKEQQAKTNTPTLTPKYEVPLVSSLQEMATLFGANGDKVFDIEVPLPLIKPRNNNHRVQGTLKFSFDTFMALLPKTPDTWQELEPDEYVKEYWSSQLTGLVMDEQLHPKELPDAMSSLQALFQTACSLESIGQRHSINAYLAYNKDNSPSHVEIIDGERRLRASHICGRDSLRVRLAPNERVADGLPDDADDVDVALATLATSYESNSSAVTLSLTDTLTHYIEHYRILCRKLGREEADALTTDGLKSALQLQSESRPQIARFIKLARHNCADLLLNICRVYKPGRELLIKIANNSTAYADKNHFICQSEHVYAYAIVEEKIDFSLEDVPEEERESTQRIVNDLTGVKPRSSVSKVKLGSEKSKQQTTKALRKLGFPTPESDDEMRDRQLKMFIAVCASIDPTLKYSGELLEKLAETKSEKENIDVYRAHLLCLIEQSMQQLSSINTSKEALSGLFSSVKAGEVDWSEVFEQTGDESSLV
ncbi:hypothetical protein CWB96_00150 [Pseudoalteromonas citrea]|uniref:ParB/Sulfiredoxin domain-containing protein n=1 Tax=Pseudoalteromonas citrea TaxID=43655 RepID=A0A5S3XVB4_9GAMM|nr:hypothetical protein [Pseudoalteromonas citrea]TMP46277.1 hypothetical protein CWB97_02145 [Pseudoalteromonas citrea]TMP63053.1 hypothetical protein CWB96_00150 [Pseudoalteromonas citrea]